MPDLPDNRVPLRATIGVEEEFHVVDPDTGMLVPEAGRLLARLDDTFTSELHQSSIESRTKVCESLDGLRDDLVATRSRLVAAADEEGLAIVSAGTAPLIDPAMQKVTESTRFQGILDDYQHLVREQLICSCQVHVGMPDMEEAVRVMNRVRPWLGVLSALAASSPYWFGEDTGYVSYRTQVWSRWPTSGVPARFDDYAQYEEVGDLLVLGGSVDPGMFYWYVRPAPATGTLEFRVADAATTIDDVLVQAALCRALVRTERLAILEGEPEPQVRAEVLRLGIWRASRFGLAGTLLDPMSVGAVTTDRAARKLLDHVRPALEDAEDWLVVAPMVDHLLATGSSAQRQRAVVAEGGDLRAVVRSLAAATRPDGSHDRTGYGGVLPVADARVDVAVDGGTGHVTSPPARAGGDGSTNSAPRNTEPGDAPTVDDHYIQIIIDEAVRRGIAVEVVDDRHGVLHLSDGNGRSELVRASMTSRTSAIAAWRCQDKWQTRQVLERAGLSVPPGRLATLDHRDREFLAGQGDVVVKPVEGQTGDGVTVGVHDLTTLQAAIDAAGVHGPDILLEGRAPGHDLRVVVIGGEVVAAALRKPASISGDGDHTARELVEDEELAVGEDEVERSLADEDLELDAVPPSDADVPVSAVANVHRGGSIRDVTAELSDDLRRAAIAACEAIGIPVAGVDLMVPDVTGSDYAIIEVNERPGLANHEPHPVVERWFDLLFG